MFEGEVIWDLKIPWPKWLSLPHNAAEYIEHAQLLAMDYPNMLNADAVRNKARRHKFNTNWNQHNTSQNRMTGSQ